MKAKQWLLLALTITNLALFSGCVAAVVAGAAVGAGSAAYVNGEFKVRESASLQKTFAATQAGLKDLNLLPEVNEIDDVSGRIEATGAGDKNITVKIHTDGNVTEIGIRVGVFGNEAYSRKVYEAIHAQLNADS